MTKEIKKDGNKCKSLEVLISIALFVIVLNKVYDIFRCQQINKRGWWKEKVSIINSKMCIFFFFFLPDIIF